MYSFLRIVNFGSSVLSADINDEEAISCLLPYEVSKPIRTIFPSTQIVVRNGREKVVFDLLLPIKKEASHTLFLWDDSFYFT